jgi:hypothetical protein
MIYVMMPPPKPVPVNETLRILHRAKGQISSLRCSYNQNQCGYIESTTEMNNIDKHMKILKESVYASGVK